eukprot:2798087-Amphidinium_carterae.2
MKGRATKGQSLPNQRFAFRILYHFPAVVSMPMRLQVQEMRLGDMWDAHSTRLTQHQRKGALASPAFYGKFYRMEVGSRTPGLSSRRLPDYEEPTETDGISIANRYMEAEARHTGAWTYAL